MTNLPCRSIGCTALAEHDFCVACAQVSLLPEIDDGSADTEDQLSLTKRYPDDYRRIGDNKPIDSFAVHQLFGINDPSGCIQYASRKLLLSGNSVHTQYQDVLEARDTLTRWLQLNQGTQ